ncbi:transcription initiation factor-like protein iib [Massarina eburnea CBS 473.64]|uniref:Transcription initiation factor IIB n=1 Tax=Massarina eburnea CBS 473.64 TaxID=1395130 RepID=A0A6A6SD14_9PLEO|nr:transcription initiation factor-like protein iib [Massarina eburnea CBS 473.64]
MAGVDNGQSALDQPYRQDLDVILMCPDCKELPPNLVENFSSGDTICGSCGRVLSEHNLDYRSEWRTFSNDDQNNDDPSRVGDAANPLLHGSQLQTEISFGDGNMRHRDLARAQNKNNLDKTNKSLQTAYSSIGAYCDTLQMSRTVADTAKILFKMADDAKIFKGKSQDAVIAACIFIACRQEGVGRSFREIFKLTNVSKKEIGRTYKTLESFVHQQQLKDGSGNKAAGSGAVINSSAFKHTQATSAAELIIRACSKLGLDNTTSIVAQECAERVTANHVAAGRSPLSITGACIYLVANIMGHPKTPKEIGQAVDVSDGTIRTAYKLIHASLSVVVDEAGWTKRGAQMANVPSV